jgi:branched-chain amino acid transport system substrate-binding protein
VGVSSIRQNRRWSAATVLVVAALVAGCGESGGGGATTVPVESDRPELKLAVVTSLSEPGVFELGREQADAVQACVDWNNANDTGVTIDLVGIEDDRGDPAVARAAVNRLIGEGAQAFVGDITSALSEAVLPLIDENGAFFVLGTSWADELTGAEHPTVFRVGVANSSLATDGVLPYLSDLAESEGVTSIGVLAEDSSFGRGLLTALEQGIEERLPEGTAVHSEIYPANSTDVTPQLLALEGASPAPEVVAILAANAARNLAIPQAFEVGLAPDAELLASWDWPTYGDFWEVAGERGVGVRFVAFEAPDGSSTAEAAAMTEALGEESSIWAKWAWDACRILAEAAADAGTVEREALQAAIEELSFEGATGLIDFATEGDRYHDRSGIPMYIVSFGEENAAFADAELVYSAG